LHKIRGGRSNVGPTCYDGSPTPFDGVHGDGRKKRRRFAAYSRPESGLRPVAAWHDIFGGSRRPMSAVTSSLGQRSLKAECSPLVVAHAGYLLSP